MDFVVQEQQVEGALITTDLYNALVRNLNAMANRAYGMVTRGASTLGTTLGGWANLFTSDLSLTPSVGPAALALLVITLNADSKDQWVSNQFRFVLNAAQQTGETGQLWIQHGNVSGASFPAMITSTSLSMLLPITLMDGANTLNVQYSTFNNAGANFKVQSARLLAWEV